MRMKRLSYAFLAAVMGVSVAGSFVSCKDYEEDLRSEMHATTSVLDALKEAVETGNGTSWSLGKIQEELEKEIKRLTDLLDETNTEGIATDKELNAAVKNLATTQAVKDLVDKAKVDIDKEIEAANILISNNSTAISDHAGRLTILEAAMHNACACSTQVADLAERVGKLEEWQTNIITPWKAQVDKWFETHSALPDSVKTAYDKAFAASNQAEVNKEAIEKHQEILDSLANNDNILAAIDADLRKTHDSLFACYNEAIDSINTNVDDLNKLISNLKGSYTGSLSDLRQEMLDSLAAHRTELNAINTKITQLNSTLTQLDQKYSELSTALTGVQDYLNELISGILIQSTRNPLFGSFALPVNMNSNVLIAYYGETRAVEFPTSRYKYYVDGENGTLLSKKDLEMMGAAGSKISAGTIVSDAEDNAGTLYLTVNPTNIDFTGRTLEMVNSLDEWAGVTLTPLKKSNKKLTFGWTRAGVSNGFYEAGVRVEVADIEKIKARTNLSELKDAFKEVLDNRDGKTIAKAMLTVYDNFSDALDANAVKYSWTDNIDKEPMSVYSHYALAATAVKPLSYKFGSDFDYQDVPYLNKVFDKVLGGTETFIDKLMDNINIPTFNVDDMKLDRIDHFTLTVNNEIKADVVLTIPASSVTYKEGDRVPVYNSLGVEVGWFTMPEINDINLDSQDVNVTVNISGLLTELQGDLDKFVDNLNGELIDEFNDRIGELNKLNDLAESFDNIETELIDFLERQLERIDNKLCSWINSANKALQPVLFVKTNDGFARISGVKKMPTSVNSNEVTLVPTSYTAEILAPAYKRLVGVTNVFDKTDYNKNAQNGDNACIAELNNVNQQENVGDVIDGNRITIPVTLKKGYTYEIAYTAVDYHGYVVARKGYISVE